MGDNFRSDFVGECLVGVDFEMNSGSFNLILGRFEVEGRVEGGVEGGVEGPGVLAEF